MFCDLGSCVKHCRNILQQDDVHQRAKHEEWSKNALRMLTDIYDTAKRGECMIALYPDMSCQNSNIYTTPW